MASAPQQPDGLASTMGDGFVAFARARASASPSSTLILTWADASHEADLLNWLGALQRLGDNVARNFGIVSLDLKTHDFMRALGGESSSYVSPVLGSAMGSGRSKLMRLYRMRLIALHDLLAASISVVMSDLDAIWLHSPLHLFERAGDIVASRGSGWNGLSASKHTGGRWEAGVCMGFVYFRAVPAVQSFLRDEVLTRKLEQDQASVNFGLWQANLSWTSTSLIQWLAPRVDHGVVPASASSGRASFKVSLLDHTRFPRDCASACTLSRNSSAVLHADDNAERLCESDPLGCTASAANCPARSDWVVVHCNGKRAEQQRLDLWHPADHRNNSSGLSAWLRGR